MSRTLLAAILLSACGSAQRAQPVVAAAEPEPEPAARAVAAPERGPAESALAAVPDGAPVLVLDTGGRRFVIVAPADATAETTPADATQIETAYHRVVLEDPTDVVQPRALHLVRSSGACRFVTTRTFRAEISAIEADATAIAPRAAWVAEGTTDACPFLDEGGAIAIAGDTAPAIEPIALEEQTGAAARRALARIPREVTPRPPARGYLAQSIVAGTSVLLASGAPDEDGCTSSETTYLVQADASAVAIAGAPSALVVRTTPEGAPHLVIVDATPDAGRPASHVRVVPVSGGAAALDLAVPIPWMTTPSC